jgi:CO/xanthine dehydrogenase Mo-binding subunit
VDVGTGLRISNPQLVAEELGVPVERITVVEGDTATTPNHGGTGGSSGTPRAGRDLRQVAATARVALLSMAAAQLKRPVSELVIDGGEVRPAAGGQGVSIASLIGGRRFELKVDPKAPLKDPGQYTQVGKSVPRPDVPAKCTGRYEYVQNVSVPGMLHGRVVRAPAFGAKLMAVDESSIRTIPNVKVVRIESFLGVVAPDEWAAIRAARELKTTWSDWQGLPGSEQLERYVRTTAVDHDQTVTTKGDTTAGMAAGAHKLEASYWWPNQSHASLGPSCAVADVRADSATVWSATQGTFGLRDVLAGMFGLPPQKVRVIFREGSGSYGSNGNDDVACDAFLLSRAVGKPVRVQWMRQDELGHDPRGPQQLLDMRAALDAQGRIAAWETEMWLPNGVLGSRPFAGPQAAGLQQGRGVLTGAIAQNGEPPYAVSSLKVTAHWIKETPLRPSNLRAPGKIANVFAVEGFTDELAAAARVDAVVFRKRGLDDPRALDAIDRAARMIGWQTRPSPNPNAEQGGVRVGRGIAYMRYKQAENYVAVAMEVAVDPATGVITVKRVTTAHDCGPIVNPDALRNQVEGCIVQTLSRTLHEEVTFDRSRVTSVDWRSYPILTFPEVPPVEVALIDRPREPIYGAGEAAAAPIAAALANAVFDATGVRLRRVPFTPEQVKAALNRA